MRHTLGIVGLLLLVAHPHVLATTRSGAFDLASDAPVAVCPTEEVWQAKALEFGLRDKRDSCPLEGACDDPVARDGAPRAPFTVPLIVHVMRTSAGVPPGNVDAAAVQGQLELLNQQYAPYDVSFELVDLQMHDDDEYHCIAPLSYFNQNYLLDIQAMKDAFATQWTEALNVFVSCQSSSIFGVLGGFAIFPWDPDALTARGGLWMNADYFGPDQTVLTHELGHCLGLWHPHRGAVETFDCNDPCSENVHPIDDASADLVGDFCKDTPATTVNGTCVDPAGTDCNGVAWVDTDVSNYMGYADETCVDHFTTEQIQRMHCWSRDTLGGLIADQLVTAHVASITLTSEGQSGSVRRGRAHVTVVDADGAPVAGATVQLKWSESYDGVQSVVTDAAGVANAVTPWVTAPVFCWRVKVLAVSGASLAYDASANVVTEVTSGKGCGGGPILIDQPVGREVPRIDGVLPNPFNPRTTIAFSLPFASTVRVDVFDVAGRTVAHLLEAALDEGPHEVVWQGLDAAGAPAASGVYYAVVRTERGVATRRLVLIK